MSRMVSTYMYDFIDPKQALASLNEALTKRTCFVHRPGEPDAPASADEKAGKAVKFEDGAAGSAAELEWTGIAPMGILIEPRLIPHSGAEAAAAAAKCPPPVCPPVPCAKAAAADAAKCSARYNKTGAKCDGLYESTYMAEYLDPKNPRSNDCAVEGEDFRTHYERCGWQPVRRTLVCCPHCPAENLPPRQRPCAPSNLSEYKTFISTTGRLIKGLRLLDHRKCRILCKHPISVFSLPVKV